MNPSSGNTAANSFRILAMEKLEANQRAISSDADIFAIAAVCAASCADFPARPLTASRAASAAAVAAACVSACSASARRLQTGEEPSQQHKTDKGKCGAGCSKMHKCRSYLPSASSCCFRIASHWTCTALATS